MKDDSIFCYNNPYGYKLKINHPEVKPFYEYYKRKIGAKILSDAQRLQFESMFLQMRNRNIRRINDEQSDFDGETYR